MIECMILGDSIAQGMVRSHPRCEHRTQVGITSDQFVRQITHNVTAHHVLISLGSNDGHARTTRQSLIQLRSKILHARVTWLLSANNTQAAQAAQEVAIMHGDPVIHVRSVVGADGVHPNASGYYRLSHMWRHN